MLNNQNSYNKLIEYLTNNKFYDIQSITEYHKYNRIVIITARYDNGTPYKITLCETQVICERGDKNDILKYGLPLSAYI